MSRELFYSPWYKFKPKVRKHFLLIMKGAGRPFVLRAGGLLPVLLRIYLKVDGRDDVTFEQLPPFCFLQLMQQSYSFLMVLVNLNK